ncbi:NUDIX domain-containing protein [Actinoplanes sp. TBRC 11911]|uniref:NUDIX hydrolase n=1 Tax=Actinoplanes sp. TBRC 11911 TaxID=2729386 RepID=UPI00145DFA53|nr:NUDIX domain-containing protein [Actinoplanes sp. TBRC 11911]NMO51976.1 NUDIX domain-containing protein [Actinoplanes sp. TBRC 11911]
MIKRAREFSGPPAPVRPAATVVLLRPEKEAAEKEAAEKGRHDAKPDFQVYVLRRASTMVFGGLYAFPGGGVDPSDCPETIRADWADLLGVSNDQARAVVGAAARELFEEAGVLLAGPADQPDRTVSDVSTDDWEADRAAVQARELTMTELLGRRGLLLRDDLLLPWGRWITPVFEPRRFDTWFFVSLLPQGQTARDVSGEADGTQWIRPAAADGLAMLPPTRRTLNSLTPYGKMEEVVAASSRRDAATPVMPRVEFTEDGGALLHIP